MKQKSNYVQPVTKVIELRVTNQLLAGSEQTSATIDDVWLEEDI